MKIIEKIKQLQEAAKKQGIIVTDITEDGLVESDLPAVKRTYRFDEVDGKLILDDEKIKTNHASKEDAATDIVDSIIKGDFEAAHEALDDFIKLYVSDKADEDENESEESEVEEDSAKEDAENHADASGIDSNALMPVEDEEDEMKESASTVVVLLDQYDDQSLHDVIHGLRKNGVMALKGSGAQSHILIDRNNLSKAKKYLDSLNVGYSVMTESVKFDPSNLSDDDLLDKFTEIEKAMKTGDPHNADATRTAYRKVVKELKRRGFNSFNKR